jgi:molecular chaperone DnaK (HSP70)
VAFANPSDARAILGNITVVRKWADAKGMDNYEKVPSVISYSPSTHAQEQQWGASLSDDAIAMINTKLELDLQDNKSEELNLILQTLDGMDNLKFEHVKTSKGYPEYTWKGPEDIVADYLTKIFHAFMPAMNFPAEYLARIPVDIVITVPVV